MSLCCRNLLIKIINGTNVEIKKLISKQKKDDKQ